MMHLFEVLRTTYGSMSPAYRRIAEYIAENYAEVAFMAASQVAAACETHESMVVKFAASLGYSGYSEMLRDVRRATKGRIDPTRYGEKDAEYLRFHSTLLSVEEALRRAGERPVPEAFEGLVEAASCATHMYVLGFHTDALFVDMISFYLDFLGYKVTRITDSGVGMYHRLRKIGQGDLLVAVSFPPHLSRVCEALQIAADRGAKRAIFTDRSDCLAASLAQLVISLDLPDDQPIVQRTVVTSLIGAWVTSLAVRDRERTLASVEQLDELLAQAEIVIP